MCSSFGCASGYASSHLVRALFFVRVLTLTPHTMVLQMSIAMLFVGLIIVLPINYSGTNDYKVTEMGRFTISNLHDDDPKMIAHSCVAFPFPHAPAHPTLTHVLFLSSAHAPPHTYHRTHSVAHMCGGCS